VPPVGNANYAWLQHIHWHLAPFGTAGVVLGQWLHELEPEWRRRDPQGHGRGGCRGLHGGAAQGSSFYSTQIPACLWFLARDKSNGRRGKELLRDRRGEVLFIDARSMGTLVDRTRRELSDEDIQKIADTYHAWRGEQEAGRYEDVPGFCKSATLDEIRKHGHVLTPGRYVGAAAVEDDGEPFTEKMARLSAQWREQQVEAARLDAAIAANLKELGYGG
jgi:type I restriction enzyme M protein